jgi:hypothetical protein
MFPQTAALNARAATAAACTVSCCCCCCCYYCSSLISSVHIRRTHLQKRQLLLSRPREYLLNTRVRVRKATTMAQQTTAQALRGVSEEERSKTTGSGITPPVGPQERVLVRKKASSPAPLVALSCFTCIENCSEENVCFVCVCACARVCVFWCFLFNLCFRAFVASEQAIHNRTGEGLISGRMWRCSA